MQEFGFIQAMETTKEEFWDRSNNLAVDQDASDVLSYMKLMYDEARAKGISLRREDFKRFGSDIDFFEGVRGWFKLVNDYGAAQSWTGPGPLRRRY